MIKLRIAIFVALILLLFETAFSQSTQLLFTLERNKNSNKVYYEAKLTNDGLLDIKDPVHVYWILWTKDTTGSTHEELSLVEKNMVYGCKINKNLNAHRLSMTIVSYSEREIEVIIHDGKAFAVTTINGCMAFLDKIYINYRETKMFPKVNYIELMGRAVQTGEAKYEKINQP